MTGKTALFAVSLFVLKGDSRCCRERRIATSPEGRAVDVSHGLGRGEKAK